MCRGVAGERAGKRCKWLIIKPLEQATTAENPRVGGSIPLLATIQIRSLRCSPSRLNRRCIHSNKTGGRYSLIDADSLARALDQFAKDRDLDQFHTPKSLAASISIEAAEGLEIFQWSRGQEDWTSRDDGK